MATAVGLFGAGRSVGKGVAMISQAIDGYTVAAVLLPSAILSFALWVVTRPYDEDDVEF